VSCYSQLSYFESQKLRSNAQSVVG
jgi:hypothetical protein